MKIVINKNSKIPLYIQIKNQIKNMIFSKQIPLNFILPSERKLAKQLNVNRSTIVKTYQELKCEGLIDSEIGKGTYVIYNNIEIENVKSSEFVKSLFWDEIYNEKSRNNYNDIISKIMNTNNNPNVISFAGGIPSPDLFPKDEFKKIQINLLNSQTEKLFSHSPVTGINDFKNEIKKLMLYREVQISNKELMITSGSQQGLDLIVRTFINPNDIILVEEPTFFGAIQLFQSLGAKVVGVPLDKNGLRMDISEYLIKKLNPKFIYTIPNFQNPTGITMSLERRYKLINLCEKYGIPIIEDDPYGELRYEGQHIPPLKALDKTNHVIYLTTFSKVISLGLRIGFIAAPEKVIDKLSLLKQLTDLHVNTLSQHMLYEFLRNDYYQTHLKKVQNTYCFKRDLMIKELNNNLKEFEYIKPLGGFYLWCKIPKDIELDFVLKNSLKKGLKFIPGNLFYNKEEKNNRFIRLNFTYPKNNEIVKGIKLLKLVLNE